MKRIEKPAPDEYAPYTIIYIGLLPDDGLVLKHLKNNVQTTKEFILSLPEEKLTFRYAEGKWTIKEILAHISDDERIYTYRALRFARNDQTELPGFEQDDYARYSGANERSIRDILRELTTVRQATISLFQSFDRAALLRKGIADGNVMSVRAAAYHIAGHELRHLNIIKERYLGTGEK
ncbi:MAG: DinB family protein [Blastocatellia bacterium]|nr:DinB family protein [Blastocatellia bacterium]